MVRELNLENKSVHLLIKDEEWLHLFKESKNLKIKHYYLRLKKIVEEKENIQKRIEEIKIEKKKDMQMIIVLSQKANDEGDTVAVQKMEEMQRGINYSNEQLDKLEMQEQNLREKMKEMNLKLLEITVDSAYKEIKKKEEDLERIIEEIESLKNRLNRTINTKYGIEEEKTRLYRWVHSFLGSDETNKLDEDYLEE